MNIAGALKHFITTHWSKIYEPNTYGEFRKTERVRNYIQTSAHIMRQYSHCDDTVFWGKCLSSGPVVENPKCISSISLVGTTIIVEYDDRDVSDITHNLAQFMTGLDRGDYDHCDIQSALFAKMSAIKTLRELVYHFDHVNHELVALMVDLNINLLD